MSILSFLIPVLISICCFNVRLPHIKCKCSSKLHILINKIETQNDLAHGQLYNYLNSASSAYLTKRHYSLTDLILIAVFKYQKFRKCQK
ncbi:hypothetical protein Pint_25891 [Pistacia integerrima]|uniref:Uncharacterized protein n=1 Tax=Pistacia integerrima TaxID=434235 RepID=A0ACC0YH02_9ROSI|nr:hypothetical protein Pint_25891 [Pistacia integerrima]